MRPHCHGVSDRRQYQNLTGPVKARLVILPSLVVSTVLFLALFFSCEFPSFLVELFVCILRSLSWYKASLTGRGNGFDSAQVKDSSHPGIYSALSRLKLFLTLQPRLVLKGCEADGFNTVSCFHFGRYLMCD